MLELGFKELLPGDTVIEVFPFADGRWKRPVEPVLIVGANDISINVFSGYHRLRTIAEGSVSAEWRARVIRA